MSFFSVGSSDAGRTYPLKEGNPVAEDLTIGGIEFKRGTVYDVAAIGRVVDTTEKT